MKIYGTMQRGIPLAEIPAHARRAERLGYSGLHVPEAVHDGFLCALLALEHTIRLRVTTSVVLAFPRSPMSVAYAAWDLQRLSGGRLELGLGTQIKANMEGRFSVEWKPPVARMRDYVGGLRAIWDCWQNGTPLNFESEHYRFTRMQPFFNPGPLTEPRIPILLGGVNPRMTELAGEVADGMITHPTNTNPRYLREVTLPSVEAGAKRAGRSLGEVEIQASGFVATGLTPADVHDAREGIRAHLGFLYSTPQYWPTLELHGWDELGPRLRQLTREKRWDEMRGLVSDAMLDALVPAGTYAEICDVLREWYANGIGAITFPMPEDPANDELARIAIETLRAA